MNVLDSSPCCQTSSHNADSDVLMTSTTAVMDTTAWSEVEKPGKSSRNVSDGSEEGLQPTVRKLGLYLLSLPVRGDKRRRR